MANRIAYLTITNGPLCAHVDHTGTDWEIASDNTFTSMLHQVLNDTENLYAKSILIPFTGVVYFRSRYRIRNQVTEWSEVRSC